MADRSEALEININFIASYSIVGKRTRSHNALVREYLAKKKNIPTLPHYPYSLDLAPCRVYLSPN